MADDVPFCPTNTKDSSTAIEDDWFINLHPSALKFVQALDLPRDHPHCHDDSMFQSIQQGPLPLGSDDVADGYYYERSMGMIGRITTVWYQVAPALLAMTELWLRLFAFAIAPLALAYLISNEWQLGTRTHTNPNRNANLVSRRRGEIRTSFIVLVGMAACTVLLTDTMYVQAHGRHYGGASYILMTIVTFRAVSNFKFYRRPVTILTYAILLLSIYLLYNTNTDATTDGYAAHSYHDHDPGIDLPTIEPGLYYDTSNPLMHNIANHWPKHSRTYDVAHGATPYLITGDGLTGIPFLVNSVPKQTYHRVWVENTYDREAVALDIAFGARDGVHDGTKPVYLVLHGLNGGSDEEYVREFVVRKTAEGHTCIVMIARGLMDTPVRGWNVFHGARTLDIETSSKAIRKAIHKDSLLVGVGFSMGAIILSNYVARSGTDCHLDAAVAVSGGLDMREQLNFQRGKRLWQPMLAQGLRDDFIVSKFDVRFRQRLTIEQHLQLMRASSVQAVDIHAIVTYNGFNNLTHYYTEMSAMGDTTAFQRKRNRNTKYTAYSNNDDDDDNSPSIGRIGQVSIPFCVIHALDDPLITWRTMGHDPDALVRSGSGTIMMLLTKSGGHVGWPLGLNPRLEGWRWMHDAVGGFVTSVDSVKRGKVGGMT